MTQQLAVAVPVSTLWTAPDAPRDVDVAAVADVPDVAGWLAGMDAQTRLGLHGRTLSQLLLGEPVELVEEHGRWARVVAPWQPSSEDERGYPGWLPVAHLGELPARTDSEAVVTSAAAALRCDHGDVLPDVSWATVLPLLDTNAGVVRLALPGGGSGTLASSDAEVRGVDEPPAYDTERLLAGPVQFRGMRYLWGGTCGMGLDCSGLVHLAFRACGVRVPRDAHDQQAAAKPVDVTSVHPGDLYFFRHPGETVHHVGMVTGDRRMLHATEGEDRVEEAPLSDERAATLCAAGRFRPTGSEAL